MLGIRFSEILCIYIEREREGGRGKERERGEKERNSQDTCHRRVLSTSI
jgi:hypothetical protein